MKTCSAIYHDHKSNVSMPALFSKISISPLGGHFTVSVNDLESLFTLTIRLLDKSSRSTSKSVTAGDLTIEYTADPQLDLRFSGEYFLITAWSGPDQFVVPFKLVSECSQQRLSNIRDDLGKLIESLSTLVRTIDWDKQKKSTCEN